MNRFYKVIWNKTRGMYVVVSEFARSHSKSKGSSSSAQHKGAQMLTAMMLAVGLSMTTALVQPLPIASAATGDIVGEVEYATGRYSSGYSNTAKGTYATVTGGENNTAQGNYSTVSGGYSHDAYGRSSGIYGGYHNITGSNNDNNSGLYAAILGGYENTATGGYATAVGGYKGSASGKYSTAIGGGSAQGDYSISIGRNSVASGTGEISFGDASDSTNNHQLKNIADGTDDHDAVALGQVYTKTQTDAQIAAAKPIVGSVNTGGNSTATGWYSTVTGGSSNTASGQQSSVAGGYYNTAGNRYTFAAGGQNNTAGGQESVVIGGSRNQAGIWEPGTPAYDASGSHSLVAGGQENLAEGSFSVILGGENNYTGGGFSAAVGGANNTTTHMNTVALGGQNSNVLGAYAASLGGRGSTVAGHWSVGIGGGSIGENVYDAIAVGRSSVVTVNNGLALGNGATTDEEGTIAFGHDAGDISGYTVTWQQNSDGSPNYAESPTITANTYSEASYNRLVKVADGKDAHDVATMGQLNNLKSTVDTHTAEIAQNATNIATNANNIATNTDAINTNTTNIATNTSDIAANKTSIDANATNITKNQTAISDEVSARRAADTVLQSNIDTKANQTDLAAETSARQAAITDLQKQITGHLDDTYTKTQTDDKFAAKTDLTSKANVSDVYTKNDANKTFATKTDLNSKADTLTVAQNTANIQKNTNTLTNHETRIKSLEDAAEKGGQAATIEAIENANNAAATATQRANEAHTAAQEATNVANSVQGQVTSLDNKIDAEVTNRQNADSNLQKQIDAKANASDVYTKTVADNIFATKNELNDKANQTDLAAETAARTADVKTLQTQVNGKADVSALQTEREARVAADDALTQQQSALANTVSSHTATLNTHTTEIANINTTLNNINATALEEKATAAQDAAIAATDAAANAQTAANDAHGIAQSMQTGVNNALKIEDDVLKHQTVTADGTTATSNATTVIINPNEKNQVKIDANGIRFGLNSGQADDEGFYAGGHTYEEAKSAISHDGSIKGADGKFKVDGSTGKVTANGMNASDQKITHVAAGTEATDAVNYGQLAQTNERVGNAERRISNLEGRVDKVGANAAAMANLHPMEFDEDTKISVAGAIGNYGSATAAAVGVFYRPTERVMFNVSSSFGNGETMIGGGVSFALGRSNKSDEKKITNAERTNLQQQVNTLKAQNDAQAKKVDELQAKLDALLSVLDPETVQKAQAAAKS